jgi:hypothetical protein
MARISARDSDGALASRATAAHVRGGESSPFKYVPGFAYILVLSLRASLSFPIHGRPWSNGESTTSLGSRF